MMDERQPDPTEPTTRQMLREVQLSREVIETRLDSMDKAVEILQKYPTELDKAIGTLREIQDERFQRIEQAINLKVEGIQAQLDKGLQASKESTALALESVNKATSISQQTADRAVAKAEAAAEKVLLQSMIDALKNNFEGQIASTREAMQAMMASQEKAVTKAENATEKRFEGVNEFRAQLSDQASKFMPRIEAEVWSRSNAEKIDAVASRMDRLEGRSGGMATGWGILASAVGVGGIILGAIMVLVGNS